MINQTGVAESGTSRWERIPAWSNRDLMLAASMNLPGVKAMPRSGGLSLVGRGCLLTVHTWILRHNRGLIGVGLHSDTFFGWENTMFYIFFFITRRKSNHLSIILWEFLFFFICCVSFCRHNNLFVHSWWLLLFITTLYWLCVIQTSSWNKKRITCMLKDLLWGKPNLIRGVYSTEQQAFM